MDRFGEHTATRNATKLQPLLDHLVAAPSGVMGRVSVLAVLRFHDELDLNGLLERQVSGFGALRISHVSSDNIDAH